MFDLYLRRRLTFLLVLGLLLLAGLQFATASSGAGPAATYDVVPGDTLWGIAAARYGGDPRAGVEAIRSRNHLRSDLIRPGEVLLLPASV